MAARLGWNAPKCKYGRLKHRKGNRVCRKRKPGRKSRKK